MSNIKDYTAKLDAINAVEENNVKTPNMPC
jgi:hypothetical protein